MSGIIIVSYGHSYVTRQRRPQYKTEFLVLSIDPRPISCFGSLTGGMFGWN